MLESAGIVRRIDELGRIVLPAEARNHLGITALSSLEILIDEENERIILRKAEQHCFRCNSSENLVKVKTGYYLCRDCIQALQ